MAKTLISVQVTAVSATTHVEVEPSAAVAGERILVTAFQIPTGVKNWIGEVPRGQLWAQPMRWKYLPDGQPQASLLFDLMPAGEWEYLLYRNDSISPNDLLARSPVVVIAPLPNRAPVWPDPPVVEFQDGVAGRRSLRIAFDPDGDAMSYAVATPLDMAAMRASIAALGKDPALADGFSFDQMDLVYDGRPFGTDENAPIFGPIETGLRVSADDGRT